MRLLPVLQLALLVLAAAPRCPVGRCVIRTAESVVLTLWPPGPLRAEDVDAQVVVVDLDVDLLGLRHHEHAGGAGVHPALRLGDRHPLDAVHAALELQQRVRRLAGLGRALGLHRDGHRLVAAEVGLGGVEHLGLPAAPLGVPGVHAQQVAGEQRRLLAALAGLHLEDRVLVVGRGRAAPAAGAAAPRRSARRAPRARRPRRRRPGPRRPARGRPEVARRSRLPAPRQVPTIAAQLGVPLVEPLAPAARRRASRVRRAAARARRARRQALDALDWLRTPAVPPRSLGRVTDVDRRAGLPRSPSSDARPAARDQSSGRPASWRSGPRSGRRGRRCRGSSACRCRTGGSCEQTSAWMVPVVAVLRVVNVLPQVQVDLGRRRTSGWMSFFMVSSRVAPGRPHDAHA